MSFINYANKEISCKIVYFGPGLGGKTSNLEHIYRESDADSRGRMISLTRVSAMPTKLRSAIRSRCKSAASSVPNSIARSMSLNSISGSG